MPNCEELGINGPLRLSRKFTMSSMDEYETFMMLTRVVKSIRHIDMQLGNIIVPFQYVVAYTGMGMLPMAVNEDIEVKEDQLIEAYADIKSIFIKMYNILKIDNCLREAFLNRRPGLLAQSE